jgi:hypothetical protein
MSLTLSLAASNEWSTRYVRWWQSHGPDLVGCGGMSRVCGRGELTVALLVRDNRERRREATEMRKTKLGSRFQLPRHAQVMSWQPMHAGEQPRSARPLTTVGHSNALKSEWKPETGD